MGAAACFVLSLSVVSHPVAPHLAPLVDTSLAAERVSTATTTVGGGTLTFGAVNHMGGVGALPLIAGSKSEDVAALAYHSEFESCHVCAWPPATVTSTRQRVTAWYWSCRLPLHWAN